MTGEGDGRITSAERVGNDKGNIKVTEAEAEDMVKLFTIASRAFATNEPFWDALFPRHLTEQGRIDGGKSFLAVKETDRHVRYIKAVDDQTGNIVGFARWYVYKDANDLPHSVVKPGPLYQTTTELEYVQELVSDFMSYRSGYIAKTSGNVVSLDICAVDPDHQRKGVGGKLVSWGTAIADDLDVDAVVESSIYGKGLYQKHGYIFEKDVEVKLSKRFADKPRSRFAWLVRPRTSNRQK